MACHGSCRYRTVFELIVMLIDTFFRFFARSGRRDPEEHLDDRAHRMRQDGNRPARRQDVPGAFHQGEHLALAPNRDRRDTLLVLLLVLCCGGAWGL